MMLRADCGRDAAADWGLKREADMMLFIPSSAGSVFPSSPSSPPSKNLLPLLLLPVDLDIRVLVVPWAATLSSLSSRASLFLLKASLASLLSCFLRNADTSLDVSTAMRLLLLDGEDLRGLRKDFLLSRRREKAPADLSPSVCVTEDLPLPVFGPVLFRNQISLIAKGSILEPIFYGCKRSKPTRIAPVVQGVWVVATE